MGPRLKLVSCLILGFCLCLAEADRGHREKRQISQGAIREYVRRALDEANQELLQQKALDKLMVDQGISFDIMFN